MNNPLVTIIVPVYKVEKYLRTCLDSVLSQSYSRWELILVDDGSPDRCGEICEEYAKKDVRIIVIHQRNGGQANARNNALRMCNGDYVTFLDSDDFLQGEAIEYMLGLVGEFGADIIQCGFIRGTATKFPSINREWRVEEYDNHSVFLSEKANVIVCGKLYRREILEAHRIKEGKFYEDDYTTWKWYYTARRIIVSDRPLYYYSVNPSSTMARHMIKPSFDFIDAYRERVSFFIQSGESDLEHCSRLQFCKSLLLNYSNIRLTVAERREIKKEFDESWKILRRSPYIRMFYKILFSAFHIMPLITSKMAVKLR